MGKINDYDFNNVSNFYTDKTLERIKAGNRLQRENFLNVHDKFICKVVSSITGKPVSEKSSEEYRIGLFALNYSIDKFDRKSYSDFLAFSEKNINQWVRYHLNQNKEATREEVALLKHRMWEFGVTLEDLVSDTPKDTSTIISSISLARRIVDNDPFIKALNLKRNLSEEQFNDIKRLIFKRIKKNRKYIIALILILKSDLEFLKENLKNIESDSRAMGYTGIVLEYSKGITVYMTGQGRFEVSNSLIDPYIGQRIYINTFKSIGRKIIKYSVIAASVLLVVTFAAVGINYIPQDNHGNDKKFIQTVSVKTNKEKSENIQTESVKESSKPSETKQVLVNGPATPVPANPGIQLEVTEAPVVSPAQENTPKVEKIIYTPIPKHLSMPAVKSNPTRVPDRIKPSKKPTHLPIPTGYPTVIASGVPGAPNLISDFYEVNVGQDFTISMHMRGGNNGTEWVLYENEKVISNVRFPDNTPNEQSVMRLITPKSPGTYIYRCELINSFGATSSSEISIIVK